MKPEWLEKIEKRMDEIPVHIKGVYQIHHDVNALLSHIEKLREALEQIISDVHCETIWLIEKRAQKALLHDPMKGGE